MRASLARALPFVSDQLVDQSEVIGPYPAEVRIDVSEEILASIQPLVPTAWYKKIVPSTSLKRPKPGFSIGADRIEADGDVVFSLLLREEQHPPAIHGRNQLFV